MRKLFVLLVVFALCLTACGGKAPSEKGGSETADAQGTESTPVAEDRVLPAESYKWQCAWANFSDSERLKNGIVNGDKLTELYSDTLPLWRLGSIAELDSLKTELEEVLVMDGESEYREFFSEMTVGYGEDFFEEKLLFVAYQRAQSGTAEFGVRSVEIRGGELLISTEQTVINCTDDLSGWLIAVEISKEDVRAVTGFNAVFAGEAEDIQYKDIILKLS